MKEPIISVSGLRGIIGESLSPILAMKFAIAFAEGLASGPIVVTRDGRDSGHMLALGVQSAMCAIGRDVIDAGIAATPTTGILVREYDAAGGIQISASHNPPPYNGLKLFSPTGRVLPSESGEEVLTRYRADETTWVGHAELGSTTSCADTTSAHLQRVLDTIDVERIRGARFRVLLDSNHGAGSLLGRRLLEALGCQITFLGDTANGAFAHPPEPTAENLAGVCKEVTSNGAIVGFCQDPDADRLALIDEKGDYVGEEYTLALCLEHVLNTRKGPVVTNCATSKMAERIAEQHGVPFHLSSVGEANVVDQMKRVDAVFGGEGNGGPIDPKVGYVRDSFVGMAMILDLLAQRQQPLSVLAADLPRFEIHKAKMELDRAKLDQAFDAVAHRFHDADTNRMDGLRLDWKDRWLLVRPSNTEPIVRAIAEAPTLDEAKSLCDEVAHVLADLG